MKLTETYNVTIESPFSNQMIYVSGAGRALSTAGPALLSAAETLAQIYHHVCAVNGTQPERVLLEHAGQGDAGAGEGRGAEAEALALAAGELEGLRAAAGVARSADTLLDQLTHLRTALDTALDSRNRHQPGTCHTHTLHNTSYYNLIISFNVEPYLSYIFPKFYNLILPSSPTYRYPK